MKTFLDGVNGILAVAGSIAEPLTDFATAAHIRDINVARVSFNTTIIDAYTQSNIPYPLEQAESTITLVEGQKSYPLADDLEQIRWPFIDKVNSQFLVERAGGYNNILVTDLEQNSQGLPLEAAISPVTGELYVDYAPTAKDAGRVYTYQYDRTVILETETDVVPFSDSVFLEIVKAAIQDFKNEKNNTGSRDLYKYRLSAGIRLLTKAQPRDNWNNKRRAESRMPW